MAGPHSGWPYPTGDPLPTQDEALARAEEIRGRIAQGESIAAIARDMGVSRPTIYSRLRFDPSAQRPRGPLRDVVSYSGAHVRVYDAKGRAADHSCRQCDQQAAHWAYTNDDPAELVDDQGLRYSLDPDRYVPMCRSCHAQLDAAYRGAR